MVDSKPITTDAEIERLVLNDHANVVPTGTGAWSVRDRDGVEIVTGMRTRETAMRLYAHVKHLGEVPR